jgi:DNA invertase Pin-like site-specific DNA recombinase
MPKAYSYLRFSTPEQSKGDSSRRQTALAQEYAAKHGLNLDDKLSFQDEGISAFRGKNAETGRLGDFLAAVRAGVVERGSYLLVESLDRISRQAARRALRVLEEIVDEEITVVTLADNRVYTREALDSDPMALIMSILIFIRANEESAMKAKRLKAAWTGKRMKAAEKPLTSVAPSWLRLDKETGTWTVNEESAAVVRRIFRDYLSGQGIVAITKRLNGENVPVLRQESSAGVRKAATMWHFSYIKRVLVNEAVVGTFTPHSTEYVNGRKTRRAQQPLPGYYPAIVDEETFQRAQAIRLNTSAPLRGRSASGDLKNLFGGLAHCARCGSAVVYVSKGQKWRRVYTYLVCLKAREGAGCQYATVPYPQFEAAFLRDVDRLLGCAPAGLEGGPIDEEVRQAQANLDALDNRLSALAEAYADTRMATLLKEMQVLEADKAELQKQQDDLLMRQGALAGPFVAKRIQELQAALAAEPFDRRRVNALMRAVFSGVTVDLDSGLAHFDWKHGGEDYVLFAFPKDAAA